MKAIKLLAISMIALIGCANDYDSGARHVPTSSGSGGSDLSSSSSTTGSGMIAVPCEDSGDCGGRDGVPLCNVNLCVEGFCQTVYDALGVYCGDGYLVCDGMGHCGDFMPGGNAGCFESMNLEARCPLCDDGDPATSDWCEEDQTTGAKHCTHYPMGEGQSCGPDYTIQNGECCPRQTVK